MKKTFILLLLALAVIVAAYGQTTIFTETMGSGGSNGNSIATWESNNYFDNDGFTYSGTGDMRNTSVSSGYTGFSGTWNVMLNTSGETFIISGIDTASYTSLSLSFGIRKNTNAETGSTIAIQVSDNGSNWSNLSMPSLPTGQNGWYYRTCTGTIPSTETLYIKFVTSSTTEFRIDDVQLKGALAAGNNPPQISEISRNPDGSVTPLNTVSVSATITDLDGTVESAELRWGITTGSYPNIISMSNSGSTYTTSSSIPAQSIGITVYYVIYAFDDAADLTTSTEMSYTVVSPPAPNAPNATAGSSISSSGFTANWDSVSGATGYLIDVYKKTAGINASDLFFSEYIEGSGNNKAIEIYNGTGSAVDLANYRVDLYTAPNTTPGNTLTFNSGTYLADGDVYVIANSSANATILALADVQSAVTWFNGDDTLVLVKIISETEQFVDVFGCIGEDPGTAWGTSPVRTAEQTLVRKPTVTGGVTANPSSGFPTLATEWDGFDQDATDYLGSHTMAGGTTITNVTGYQNLNVGNVTSYNVTDLDPETTYYYVVRAYDVYDQTSSNSNEITVSTTAAPANIVINADGTATGAAIVSGGSIPESLLGADSGAPAVVYTITSTGVKDVTVYKTAAFTGDWYCWLNTLGGLIAGANPIQGADFYVFEDVNFDAKGDVVVIINDNSTLPVELSSFTATLSAQNLVRLMWITQSETGVTGYYIYRGIDTNASAAQIVSPLITATNTSTTQSYVYVDSEIFETGTYYYWLQNVDIDGTTDFHGPIRLDYVAGQNNGTPNIPVVTELKNVYPNPFNPIAFISYSLAENNPVAIKIYNNRGQLVRVLDNAPATAGNHRIEWNGMDNSGNACSTGLYLVRMTAGNKTFTQKVVLVK